MSALNFPEAQIIVWKAGVVPQGGTAITGEIVKGVLEQYEDFRDHRIIFIFSNCYEGMHAIKIDSKGVYVRINDPECFNRFFTCSYLSEYSYFFKHRVLSLFFQHLAKLPQYIKSGYPKAVRERYADQIGNPGIPDTQEKLIDYLATSDTQEFHEFSEQFFAQEAAQRQQRQQQNNN